MQAFCALTLASLLLVLGNASCRLQTSNIPFDDLSLRSVMTAPEGKTAVRVLVTEPSGTTLVGLAADRSEPALYFTTEQSGGFVALKKLELCDPLDSELTLDTKSGALSPHGIAPTPDPATSAEIGALFWSVTGSTVSGVYQAVK